MNATDNRTVYIHVDVAYMYTCTSNKYDLTHIATFLKYLSLSMFLQGIF